MTQQFDWIDLMLAPPNHTHFSPIQSHNIHNNEQCNSLFLSHNRRPLPAGSSSFRSQMNYKQAKQIHWLTIYKAMRSGQ